VCDSLPSQKQKVAVRVLAASAVDFLLECLGLGSSRPGSGEGLLLQDGPSSSQHHLRSDSARRLVETDAAHSLPPQT